MRVKSIKYSKNTTRNHALDISVEMISKIEDAFSNLDKAGNLKQGKGIFEFEEFQIHL